MKLFILSKGRSKTICTHKYLPEGQYKIVLHNKGEKKDYLKNSSVPPESIIVSDQPYNLPKQRNFVKFELAKKETWYGCFDDNIHGFQVHPEPFYSMDKIEQNIIGEDRKKLQKNILTFSKIEKKIEFMIRKAEKIDTGFIGLAKSSNYFFRKDKWKTINIVCHKACFIKQNEIRYDERIVNLQDKHYSAECLLKYGKILMNNFIYPVAEHNQAGGLGTLKERIKDKIEGVKLLMKMYPGLFKYYTYPNCPPQSDIKLKIFSEKKINEWREKMKEIKNG